MPDRICADCGEPGATFGLETPHGWYWSHDHLRDCIAALRARLAEVERERDEAENRVWDAVIAACRQYGHEHYDQSPVELIHLLGDERDAAREREAGLLGAASRFLASIEAYYFPEADAARLSMAQMREAFTALRRALAAGGGEGEGR